MCVHTMFVKLYSVLNAHIPPTNPEEVSTVVFPEDGETQITIPASAIIHQRNTEGSCIYMHTYVLPCKNVKQQCTYIYVGMYQ